MFGVGAGHLARDWHDLQLDVVGLDWRMSIKEAREKRLVQNASGESRSIDIACPLGGYRGKGKEILDQGMQTDRFIFNLGHGIFPEVSPDALKKLTAFVHEYSASKQSSMIP